MSFIDKNLLPQEEVVYRSKLHWIIYAPAAGLFVLAILAFINGIGKGQDTAPYAYTGCFFAFFGILSFVLRWIDAKTSEFAVTDKRVLIKIGFIRRHSLELLLRQVEGIGVDQGIVGRLLGFGTITVSGTGGTKEPFRRIGNPLEFRRQVQTRTVS